MSKLIVFFVLFSFSVQAQVTENSSTNETATYYWYFIHLDKKYDKETSTNRLYIKYIGNDIRAGSFDEFTSVHQSGLSSGSIAIGPFSEQSHASQSQYAYSYAGRESAFPETKLDPDEVEPTYTFFYTKPIGENFQQNIGFERIPSRVNTGTLEEFVGTLNEGLYFEKLAVGPFYDYNLAEKSKFVFRKNGELGSENVPDTLNNNGLQVMAKKWKTLNLEITKKSIDRESNKFIYRFSTRFPSYYFDSDAFQVITIKASYSESFNSSSTSFTLQGDKVVDNNPDVSYTMGTVYINVLQFEMYGSSKINGFLFESFIYNDTEIIELEPLYISID